MSRKIFIAGCARSGTSLTKDLMRCFEETYVIQKETRVDKFDELDGESGWLVIKRTAGSYKRLPKLGSDIELIYCLRHPVDVLTSKHPKTAHLRRFHVTCDRWIAELDALKQLRAAQPKRPILYIRYEDLVKEPDRIQNEISKSFGLKPRIKFSEDPDNPIVASSIEKWRSQPELLSYVLAMEPDFLRRVGEFCDEFGYKMPASTGSGPG
ncbi:MAG: sulfotransferase [Hyphomicrobiales bacterium]|nr:sulfotransferase [Hyphomicrobiales bacterium]